MYLSILTSNKYEYEINAKTGDIIKKDIEKNSKNNFSNNIDDDYDD